MDVLGTALSGIQSARTGIAASAHNLANLMTEDFEPRRTTQTSRSGGGSQARVSQATESRGVDIAREVVGQIQSSTQYTASLRVLEVGAELRGGLLDILA